MSTDKWVSGIRSGINNGGKPQEVDAQDLELAEIEPYYPNRRRNRTILAVAVVVAVVVVATVAVIAQKNKEVPVAEQFLSGLPAYSIKLAESDPESPQAKALDWLQKDPRYNEYELHRLNQRYALAVFYHATAGGEWTNSDKWVTEDNECSWYATEDGDICGENSRLTVLSLDGNALGGTVPTELELLTNLSKMYLLEGAFFWVTVYPQLYVSTILYASALNSFLINLRRNVAVTNFRT
jgi:hypothetical protein